jgi:hypothetical protein
MMSTKHLGAAGQDSYDTTSILKQYKSYKDVLNTIH